MEAGINALAQCCHELFPVMDMVTDIETSVVLPTKDITSRCVSVHDNNAGYLVLANTLLPQVTPRNGVVL